jgi:protein TonB
MFDKLVESARQKQEKRAGRFFIGAALIYALALTAFGALAIIGFSPALAEEYGLFAKLAPPPPLTATAPQTPQPQRPNLKSAPNLSFATPVRVEKIPTLNDLKDLNPEWRHNRPVLYDGRNFSGIGRDGGVPVPPNAKDTPPPPPPAPKPAATQAEPQVVRLTSMLTQGRALRKIQPPYPPLARQSGVQGAVQVQISISEAGEVTEAFALSGHPLLRDAALRAARQWLFKPTELNGKPTRAIGVITFNFILMK